MRLKFPIEAAPPSTQHDSTAESSQLYKGHLIVAEGSINEVTSRWRVMIDITSLVDRQSRVLKVPSQEFETKEEAETFGVKFAQNWIDQER